MAQMNIPGWAYLAILLGFLVIAGVAEYLKMIPAGTFGYIFAITLGLIAPSPVIASHVHDQPKEEPTVVEPAPAHETVPDILKEAK